MPPLEGSVLHLLLRSTGFGEGAASGRGVTCRVLSTVGFFDAGLARRCGGESHARADALVSPDARWAHAGVARCGTVPSPCASPELAYEAGHSLVRRTLPRRRRERSATKMVRSSAAGAPDELEEAPSAQLQPAPSRVRAAVTAPRSPSGATDVGSVSLFPLPLFPPVPAMAAAPGVFAPPSASPKPATPNTPLEPALPTLPGAPALPGAGPLSALSPGTMGVNCP